MINLTTVHALNNSDKPALDTDFEEQAISSMACELKKLRRENAILKSEVVNLTDDVREKDIVLGQLSTECVSEQKLRLSLEVEIARLRDEIGELEDSKRWLDVALDEAQASTTAHFREAYCFIVRELPKVVTPALISAENSIKSLYPSELYSAAERRVAARNVENSLQSLGDSINGVLEKAELKAYGLEA